MDNILPELLKNGGEASTTVLTTISRKIWETKEWPEEWTQSLVIPLPKKDNLKQYQNHSSVSKIGHLSNIMLLRVILNRLKAKAGELLAEEQPGFRSSLSTVRRSLKVESSQRSTFNTSAICSVVVVFDRILTKSGMQDLWQVIRSFNIDKGLVQAIQAL